MGLADVARVQQRGVALDVVTIPRVEGLAHDPEHGLRLVAVLEVRLERRDVDVGIERRQVDHGGHDTGPGVDDDALVDHPIEILWDFHPDTRPRGCAAAYHRDGESEPSNGGGGTPCTGSP